MVKKTGSDILVIKIGTSIVTDNKTNLPDEAKIKNIASQVSRLAERGLKVLIVTSGAIGAGMGLLGLKTRPQSLPKLQACAAVGQGELMRVYSKLFKKYNLNVAQILLTQDDLNSRERYLNAKNTLFTLLDSSVVPIINENDTVATDEIRFGDNDRLSSLVANLVNASKLIMLTSVDHLYKHDSHGNRTPVCSVEKITKEIEDLAGGASSKVSVGGMVTKIQAAKIATGSGIICYIANGNTKEVLLKIMEGGKIGTVFYPYKSSLSARKKWIAFTSKIKGSLFIDDGALDAVANRHKSLLSSGIIRVDGHFNTGDSIGIKDKNGNEIARGIVNYSSKEINKIKGLKTADIEKTLGYKYCDEVIHKDNLVLV